MQILIKPAKFTKSIQAYPLMASKSEARNTARGESLIGLMLLMIDEHLNRLQYLRDSSYQIVLHDIRGISNAEQREETGPMELCQIMILSFSIVLTTTQLLAYLAMMGHPHKNMGSERAAEFSKKIQNR
ncbi:unnamed protein product [Brassica oleracea]|uniref:Uncharacterized protein n=1 Tax=Brassica oleracea TaxID=3712 RepID=A0A3P6C3M7_BRAOL|nr:unnamed protein product [Brassica oleracea]